MESITNGQAIGTTEFPAIKYSKYEILEFKKCNAARNLPVTLSPKFYDGRTWNPEKYLRSCWNSDPSVHDRISNRRDVPRDEQFAASVDLPYRRKKSHRARRYSNRSGSRSSNDFRIAQMSPSPRCDEPEWAFEKFESDEDAELHGFDGDHTNNSGSSNPRLASRLSNVASMPPPSQLTDLDMKKLLGIDITDGNYEVSSASSQDRNEHRPNNYPSNTANYRKSAMFPQPVLFDSQNAFLTDCQIYEGGKPTIDHKPHQCPQAFINGTKLPREKDARDNVSPLFVVPPVYNFRRYSPESDKSTTMHMRKSFNQKDSSNDATEFGSVNGSGISAFSQSYTYHDYYRNKQPMLQLPSQVPSYVPLPHQLPVMNVPTAPINRHNMPLSTHMPLQSMPSIPMVPCSNGYLTQQPVYYVTKPQPPMPPPTGAYGYNSVQDQQAVATSRVYVNPMSFMRFHQQMEEQNRQMRKAKEQQQQQQQLLNFVKKPEIHSSLIQQEGIDERLFQASTQIVFDFAIQAYKDRCMSRQGCKPNEETRVSYNLLTKQHCGRQFLKAVTDNFGDFVLENLIEPKSPDFMTNKAFGDRKLKMNLLKPNSTTPAIIQQRRPSF